MGYTINIGNAELDADWNDKDYDEPHASWRVNQMELADAPEFSDSGKRNSRWPSYTVWSEFACKVGLHAFFFDENDGKMRSHPGCQRLTKADAETVAAVLSKYRELHPEAVGRFCDCPTCDEFITATKGKRRSETHDQFADPTLARLEWLNWWVAWAVEKCERPAIYNS